MRLISLGLVLVIASASSQVKDERPVAEKASVISLDDLKTKLGEEGWVTETVLPEFFPFGLDKKELSKGIDIHAYWITNPAVPIKSVKLRKGVEEKVAFKGLSIEKATEITLPCKNGDDLKLLLSKTPVRYDRESETALGLTIRASPREEEIKVVLVERAIRIKTRGVEQHYFTGSSTVMVFKKKMAKEQKKSIEK